MSRLRAPALDAAVDLLVDTPDEALGLALIEHGRAVLDLVRTYMEAPSAGMVSFTRDDGSPTIRLTALGCVAFMSQPAGELGFLLDLDGLLNRPPSAGDYSGPPEAAGVRVLMAPGQAAELVVELLNAARHGGDPTVGAFIEALDALRGA